MNSSSGSSPSRAGSGVERMTALDSSFLYAETPRTPMHVGSLAIFEGAPFFDDAGVFRLDAVRERVEERLARLPRFRKRPKFLPFQFARPVWVDDPDFDIANHVKLMVLPAPGSRDELDLVCGQLQMRVLDRSHPLWELWFIGGLDDGNVALVEKIHHSMIDGVSGVEVAAALLDLEPHVAPIDVEPWTPTATSDLGLLVEGVCEAISQPVAAARHLGSQLVAPREILALATGVPDLARSLLGHGRATGLHHAVGRRRTLRTVSEPLARLKEIGHTFDATINDVALTAVAGGVLALMAARGEAVDDALLHVLVPVSMRPAADQLTLGNQVAAMIVPVPVGEGGVIERLGEVRNHLRRSKADHQSVGAEILVDSLDLLPSGVLALTSRAIHHQPLVDIVVTNIPGPPFPLYFDGAELLESIPIVPLGGNLTLGVAIMSYNGRLTFGVHADGAGCPDVAVFVEGLRGDLEALLALSAEDALEGTP